MTDKEHKPYEFNAMFKKQQFKINRVPIDSRPQSTRWGGNRPNGVSSRDFSIEEIQDIIRGGDLNAIRELSRLYYRTNSRYRANVDYLASLPLYDTVVTPIFENNGKGSKTQIIKAFYNACNFIELLDVKNTFTRITREWIKTGIYSGILQEKGGKLVITDLPIEYSRTRYKDFNNLNILEFNLQYFIQRYTDVDEREAAVLTFPEVVQKAWRQWKAQKLESPWVEIPASAGGVSFCFAEDQTPLLIASIPELYKLKDAIGREEKRDENELYKLLIQRMPIDNDGELVFELDEVADIHAGVANMLQNLDTVDVLTTFGETTLENLQDSTAASQSADRIDKYSKNAWDSLGRSSLLFNADNSSSLAYMIKKDESLMKTYLNVYNTWIKYHLNSRFSRTGLTFDFEFLPTSVFNRKELQSQYFQGAQYGYSKMYAGVASGIKQMDQISLMTFENDFLEMTTKMIPLMSSYTSSGGNEKNSSDGVKKESVTVKTQDLTNTGGRPELPDEEKSEKTQANIASAG